MNASKLRLAALSLAAAAVLRAQAPTGFVTVFGNNLLNADGSKATGTLTAQVLANGSPVGTNLTSGGQITASVIQVPVVAGAFRLNLPDTSLTRPQNVCIALSGTAADGSSLLGLGFECLQPTSASNYWCSNSSCNLDNYIPYTAPLTTVQSGPPGGVGPAGPAATVTSTGSNGSWFVTGPQEKVGSDGRPDFPTDSYSSQNPVIWASHSFTDSNIPAGTPSGQAFAHGFSAQNIFNRSSGNCAVLGSFPSWNSSPFPGCAYAEYDSRTAYTGTNNYNHYVAFQGAGELSAGFSGTLDQWYGANVAPHVNGGTLNTYIGYSASNAVMGGGTLHNQIGFYVPATFNAGDTNNWAMRIDGVAPIGFLDDIVLFRPGPNSLNLQSQKGSTPFLFNVSTTSSASQIAGLSASVTSGARMGLYAIDSTYASSNVDGSAQPNMVYLSASSAAVNGLELETDGAAPIRLATNGTTRVKVWPSGGIGLGNITADPGNGNVQMGGLMVGLLYTPPSSSSACTAGMVAEDANYHYACVGTNHWRRAALSDF